MKNIKLSHSAVDTYRQCPMSYKLKYIDGYRETTLSSALFLGSSLGDTLQMIVLDKKENLTDEEKEIVGSDPYSFFDVKFSTANLNGEEIELVNSTKCRYFKGDYQGEILNEEDLEILNSYKESNGFLAEHNFDYLYGEMKSGNATEAELSFMNLHFWLSLRRKAHYIIDEFLDKINPKIIKVYEIEGEIKLENGVGDIIRGFLDLLVDYQFEDGVKKCIIDLKTASAKYKQEKLDESQQLTLYNYDRCVGLVGYVVALKKIKQPKRGARKGETHAEFQELFGHIPEATQERIIGEIDEILHKIKNEEFDAEMTEKECQRIYGRRCPYYDICYNGDDSKLFKKERK